MTAKSDFTPDEWKLIQEGPATAGMLLLSAESGGTFRETMAMSKAYVETRAMHGQSELLDEIVAAKPKMEHTRYHSMKRAAFGTALARILWTPGATRILALGVALTADDSILIEVTAGSAIVYGATTDNSSQDPALQLARPLP